jgi:hypothetical protein
MSMTATQENELLADSAPNLNPVDPAGLAVLFRSSVRFIERRARGQTVATDVLVERLAAGQTEPLGLTRDALPLLAIPSDWNLELPAEGVLTLVAAEGADHLLANSVTQLLVPAVTGLAILHVTWLPGTVASPLEASGLDNPEPSELLLYRGAVEALVETANGLRQAGFNVSTHLREARDPAEALRAIIDEARPALVVLGLGKHGAGIGQRLLREVSVPILYVAAR